MFKLDHANSTCHIYTRKEGILSLLAHDLKLRVEKFQITNLPVDKGPSHWQKLDAVFYTNSIKTVCAMKDNREAPSILTRKDREDIERNIAQEVLHPDIYPEITFSSRNIAEINGGLTITGDLTICKAKRTIKVFLKQLKGKYLTDVRINQLDFGIKPFCALMGAMKVRPEIRIRITLPCLDDIKKAQ